MRIPIIVMLATLMLVNPFLTYAQQQDDVATAIMEGERDAKADFNKTAWIFIGCLTGGVSYLYPDIISYQAPQGKLIGKSPAYAAAYTDSYLKTRLNIIHSGSCIGGVIYWGCCVLYIIASVAAAPAS